MGARNAGVARPAGCAARAGQSQVTAHWVIQFFDDGQPLRGVQHAQGTTPQITPNRGSLKVALASSRSSLPRQALPEGQPRAPVRVLAPPGLLRCLIVSLSDERASRLQSAAEKEAWEAVVCRDAKKFLRHVFQQKVPLTLIDLPPVDLPAYEELKNATIRVCELSDSLLIICGADGGAEEELWARELGVWTYLPEVSRPAELDWIFGEARKALAKRSTVQADAARYE